MLRVLLAIGLTASALMAQSAKVDPEFIKDWSTSKQFTIAVAEAMPADKYDFKVSPEEMSFGVLMIHIAASQAIRFASIAGRKMPLQIPTQIDKARVKEIAIGLLNQSFDFCIEQLGQFTPEQLAKVYQVDWFERPTVTGRELVLGMFTHTAHHRGQAEVYLRANGIKPPPYRF